MFPGKAFALCADPVAEKGSIVFNDTYSTMMFCDGTVWWDMKAGTGGVWFRSSNSDISYTDGNVGVGTDAPLSTLHVAGPLLLDNSGSCDGGGVNKGALRLSAAADSLEICDGAGSWLPFAAEGGGSGGSGGGAGGSGTMIEGWPDAIQCSDATTTLTLYYRNLNDSRVAYAPPQVDANPQYILYDKDNGAYFSHSNMAGFDCVDSGLSIAAIEAGGNAFKFVGGSVWLSSSNGNVWYSSGNVGIGTDMPDEALDVAGLIRASSGLKFTSGALTFPDGSTMESAATGSGTGGVWLTSTNDSVYYTSGNIGIGTESPSSVLDVLGEVQVDSNGNMRINGADASANIGLKVSGKKIWASGTGSANSGLTFDNWIFYQDTDGSFKIGDGASVSVLTADTAGNVGIGTISPDEVLTVSGGIKFTSGTLTFPDGSTMNSAAAGSGTGGIWNTSGSDIHYNSGSVVIGSDATNSGTGNPEVALTLKNPTVPWQLLTFDGDDDTGDDWHMGVYGGGGLFINHTSFNSSNTAVSFQSSGNVGIGTASPSTKLHIASGGATHLRLEDTTALGWDIANRDAGTLKFIQSGAGTRVSFSSTGNVGIGTDSPEDLLHLFDRQDAIYIQDDHGRIKFAKDDGNYVAEFGIKTSGSGTNRFYWTAPSSSAEDMILNRYGNVGIGPTGPDPIGKFQVEGGDVIFNSSGNGNVGIGTAAPTDNLDVHKSGGAAHLAISSDKNSGVATLGRLWFRARDTAGNDTNYARLGGVIVDGTDGAEDGRLDIYTMANGSESHAATIANGNLGIGTTSPSASLDIERGDADIFRLKNTAAGTSAWRLRQLTSNGAFALQFSSDPEPLAITTAGKVGIGTTSPDQKLSVAGTVESTSGGFKFPDGTTQASAASGGGVSLDSSNCVEGTSVVFDADSGGLKCPPVKTVFVTTGTSKPFDDTLCSNEASSAGLSGTFKAWATQTSSYVGPASDFTQHSGPYVLPDGTKVADNWSDLTDGQLDNGINQNADGSAAGASTVWTGVAQDGTAITSGSAVCYEFCVWCSSSSGVTGRYGNVGATDSNWTDAGAGACNIDRAMICVEQ